MLKSPCLTSLLVFLSFTIQAQSIEGSFVNAGYGEIQTSVHLTYSIGDIVYGNLSNEDIQVSHIFPTSVIEELVGIGDDPGRWVISVYPNPFSSSLYIQSNLDEMVDIFLYDVNGVLLRTLKQINYPELNFSGLPDGLYILMISNQDKDLLLVEKVIKSN